MGDFKAGFVLGLMVGEVKGVALAFGVGVGERGGVAVESVMIIVTSLLETVEPPEVILTTLKV